MLYYLVHREVTAIVFVNRKSEQHPTKCCDSNQRKAGGAKFRLAVTTHVYGVDVEMQIYNEKK